MYNLYTMMTSSNGNIFCVIGHLCGEFSDPRWIPRQRPVAPSFDVFFDLRLNKRLSKQSWSWRFETPLCPLWRHCNTFVREYFRWTNIVLDNDLTHQSMETSSKYPFYAILKEYWVNSNGNKIYGNNLAVLFANTKLQTCGFIVLSGESNSFYPYYVDKSPILKAT